MKTCLKYSLFVCLVVHLDFFFFFLQFEFLAILLRNFESKIDLRRSVISVLFSFCSLWRYLHFNSNQFLRDLKPKV